MLLKSVHFKKPVTRSPFLSKSVFIFNITLTNMTTLFERNEDRVTGFLKWTDFSHWKFLYSAQIMHCTVQYWCLVSKTNHDQVFSAALLNGRKIHFLLQLQDCNLTRRVASTAHWTLTISKFRCNLGRTARVATVVTSLYPKIQQSKIAVTKI